MDRNATTESMAAESPRRVATRPVSPFSPGPRHSRESGNLPLATAAPCADALSSLDCPYDPRAQCPRRRTAAPDGGGSIWPHFGFIQPQNRPQNAPFRPRIGLIRRWIAGVNGAKMEPLFNEGAPRLLHWTGATRPVSPSPMGRVIPAKAGTYWRHRALSAKREPTPPRSRYPLPPRSRRPLPF